MKESETFQDHIKELRKRLFRVLIALILATAVGYLFRDTLMSFILRPLRGPVYYSNPAGSFNFTMKVSLLIGVFLSLPILIYQVLKFIEPALDRLLAKTFVIKVLLSSTLLSLIGAVFGFFLIIPISLHFFAGFSNANIKPLISASDYLTYVINILISFALLFQIPLIVLFINSVKPISPRKILKYQKFVVIGALIISVVLPFTYDPISQFVVAIPIILLYYLSVLMVYLVNKKYSNNYEVNISRLNLISDVDIDEVVLKDYLSLEKTQSNHINQKLAISYAAKQISNAQRAKTIDGFI